MSCEGLPQAGAMVGREALLVLVAVMLAKIFFIFLFFATVEGDKRFVSS